MTTVAPQPTITVIPMHGAVAAQRSTTLDVLIRITPPDVEITTDRPPLNLGLAIDCSGSMSGSKLAYAKQAACFAVENLLPSDRVSVVMFDSDVNVLVPSTLATDKGAVLAKIRQIGAGSCTALHQGWVQSGLQVSHYLHNDHLNRVLVLSDGLANVGETNPDTIATDVHGLSQRGVSTTTLGVGNDYSEDLMEAMARSGDGNFYHIESPDQLPSLFEAELNGLSATMGHRVSLGLKPKHGAVVKDVLNDFDLTSTQRYKLPNLVLGSPINVVMRLQIPALDTATDLCDLRLAWDDPNQSKRQVLRATFSIPVVSAEQLGDFPPVAEVQEQVALLMAARARQEAIHFSDQGDYVQAMGSLRNAKNFMAACPPSAMLAEESVALDDLEARYSQGDIASARKLSKSQRYNLQRSRPSQRKSQD
jgi:Ca-activated chloride channel family protein